MASNLILDDDGDTKIQVEETTDEDIIRFDIAGTEMVRLDNTRLEVLSDGGNSVYIGENAGSPQTSLANRFNVAIGPNALGTAVNAEDMVAIGDGALINYQEGFANIAIGEGAARDLETGDFNTIIGDDAGRFGTNASNNTFIGRLAGSSTLGSGNVFLGARAGQFEVGSNKLYIENSESSTPLIYGDFDVDSVHIHGTLRADQLVGDGSRLTGLTDEVDDADADATNELQALSYDETNNILTLSNGGTVDLTDLNNAAAAAAAAAAQAALLEAVNADNRAIIAANIAQSNQTLLNQHLTDDQDLDATNELQALSYDETNNILTLSNGGTVDLSDLDNTSDVAIAQTTADVALGTAEQNETDLAQHLLDDQDLDPTNEIELPTGGNDGQILSTDGTGNYSWIDASTATGGTIQGADGNTYNIQPADDGVGATVDLTASGFGTFTVAAGNVRGEHAVDLQTVRQVSSNVASGDYSVLIGGVGSSTSADFSAVVGGAFNVASEEFSTVIGGSGNSASGVYSVAGGQGNTSSGEASATLGGFLNDASGDYSGIIWGRFNTAPSYGETVVGIHSTNYTPNNSAGFNGNDRIFTVGNGANIVNRSNAMTILKNGNVGIGADSPNFPLEMESGAHVTAAGVWTNASDRNKKYEITDLINGLAELRQLRPTAYRYKADHSASVGFIAQELKLIIPEVVSGEEGEMGVAYGLLTAILTKGVQELADKNEQLEQQLHEQQAKIDRLEAQLTSLEKLEQQMAELKAAIEKNGDTPKALISE